MKLTEKLLLITEFQEGIEKNSDLVDVYKRLAELSKTVTSSDRSSLFIYNAQTDQLESQVAEGLPTKIYVKNGEGLVGQCAQQKAIVTENDVDTTKSFNADIDLGSGYVTQNTLTVPILYRGERLLGVIQVLNKKGGSYNETDEELLLSIAKIASVAIKKSL